MKSNKAEVKDIVKKPLKKQVAQEAVNKELQKTKVEAAIEIETSSAFKDTTTRLINKLPIKSWKLLRRIKLTLSTKDIAVYSIYLSIFLILGLGFMAIPGMSVALMIVPLIMITLHKGWRGAVFGTIAFATISFISAPLIGYSLIAFYGWGGTFVIFFIGRLLLLIPILLAIFITNKYREKINKYLRSGIISFTIVIFNTLIVLLLMALWTNDIKRFTFLFASQYALNIVIEWVLFPTLSLSIASYADYLYTEDLNERKNLY